MEQGGHPYKGGRLTNQAEYYPVEYSPAKFTSLMPIFKASGFQFRGWYVFTHTEFAPGLDIRSLKAIGYQPNNWNQ